MSASQNRPTHRVYAVRRFGEGKEIWAEIGAGWANRPDHKSLTLRLTLMPVGEADIVIREIEHCAGTGVPHGGATAVHKAR
jgi:hypothetical protein